MTLKHSLGTDRSIGYDMNQGASLVDLLNYSRADGQELVGLAVEIAEDPNGGVQVRVLMDPAVVGGVTVVPLQQGGCCG